MAQWLPKAQPWFPPDHDEEVVNAVRATQHGNANSAQQQTFWRYLMYVTGASEEFADLSFRPEDNGGTRATDFAEGKRFVGRIRQPPFGRQASHGLYDAYGETAHQKRAGGNAGGNERRARPQHLD